MRGEFEVTVSHLRTEFTDEVHSLRGEFEVTVSHLRTEFEDDVNSVRSYMHQTASSWEARVEGVTDANGNITAASIALAVNAEGSEARINADRIYLLGQTIANTIDANYIATKIESISSLLAQNITAGDIDASSVKIRPVAGMGAINVATAYNGSSLTRSGNTYTLRLAKMNGEYDEYSFSRATTLSGAWSGRRFTVTASPQGDELYTDLWSAVPAANVTWDGTIATLNLYATLNGGETTYNAGPVTVNIASFLQDKTGTTKKFTANGLYSADSGYVGFGNIEIDVPQSTVEPTTLSIQWNGSRRLNANASPQGVSRYTTIVSSIPNSDITFSGTTLTLPLKATYDGSETTVAVGSVTANISGKLQTKTISENGTVNPDSGYIGFGSVTVAVPTTNASARFGASEGSYFIEAYDRTSGTSITGSSVTYKLAKSGNKVQIQNTSSVQLSSTPEYDMSTDLTNAGYSGRANVTLNDPTWNPVTGATPDYRTVTVTTTGRTNTSGAADNLSKSVALYLTQGSWSSNQLTVSMRTGGTDGTVYASTTVDASTLVSNATTNGKNSAKVTGPTWTTTPSSSITGNSNTATFNTDAANPVSGSSKSLALYMSQGDWSSNKKYVYVHHTDSTAANRIARYEVDASSIYTNGQKNGWAGYWNRLQYPKAKTNAGTANDACMTVYYPNSTYDSAYDSVAKVYTISSGDNTAYMKDASGNVMAQITHNKYTNGYNSAKLSGSWGSGNNNNVWTVSKGTTGNDNAVSMTINADVSQSYNTTTHKYTAYGYANDGDGTRRATSAAAVSGTEAYNDGYNANRSGWIAYGKGSATISQGYLGPGNYVHAYTNNIDGNSRDSNGYWWIPTAWLRYVNSAGSNHQGDLASDKYIELIYTNSDASGDVRGTGATWHVPKTGSSYSNSATLYCYEITTGSTGVKTVRLSVQYSASQSVPFSSGKNYTMHW